ncbi:MAG: TonB-dependent receptor [Caulobacteraceae bacterium]|nr:TonB-dependent receptor [Caulobacteraceae bacterium]
MKKLTLVFSASVLVLGACGTAVAADATAATASSAQSPSTLSQVVVTARRREENVQKVPLSVTVFSARTLQTKGITEIRDLKQAVPGLYIVPGTFRESTPEPFIRGFPGGGLQIDQDPSIPFIVNEVPYNEVYGLNSSIFDVADIQVLKGPQGTLQGRNTVGGAILITTQRPNFNGLGGHLTIQYGNYNDRLIEGVLNAPVNDRLALRAAVRAEARDGTWTNIADGRKYSDKAYFSGRFSALWRVTDEIENYTVFDLTKSNVHGTAIVFQAKGFDFNDPSTYPTNGVVLPCKTPAAFCGFHNIGVMLIPGMAAYLKADAAHQASLGWGKFDSFLAGNNSFMLQPPFEHMLNWGVSNTTTGKFGGLTAKNIFGYRRLLEDYYEDIDGTSKGVSTTLHVPAPLLSSINAQDFEQLSDEVQFQGTALEGRVNWIGGAFGMHYDGWDSADATQFGPRFSNHYHADNSTFGIYGQVDVKLTDKFSLTGGYRYTWDFRKATYQQLRNYPPFSPSLFQGFYGQNYILPPITNPFGAGNPALAQCNFNVAATSTHPAFAGVNPADCSLHASLHDNAPSYNITFTYHVTDDVMVYVAHRRGYRAGFLSARATSFENMVNLPETLQDVEGGFKSQFSIAGMPARFNGAGYYSWYSNIAVTIPRTDPVTGLPVNEAENSGAAHLYGAEESFDIRPVEGLEINESYAYTYAAYDNFPSQTVSDALGNPLIFYSNANLQFGFPRHQFNIGATYQLPLDESVGTLTLAVNYSYTSSRPDGLAIDKGFDTLPAYGLVNLRLDWRDIMHSGLDLALWGNNVTNEHYLTSTFAFEDAAGFRSGFPGDPATFGATLTYRFGSERR